jgi:hypothetical protein
MVNQRYGRGICRALATAADAAATSAEYGNERRLSLPVILSLSKDL